MTNVFASIGRGWDRMVDGFQGQPKVVKLVLLVLMAVFFYALPILNLPVFTTAPRSDLGGVMFSAASYALIAVGLNIVIGYAGLLDLGYVGFYAVGAYTTAILTHYHFQWPFLLVLPISIVVTMITGVLLGAPTLRVRGDYLAIVTLGFGEIIRIVATNLHWLGGSSGISQIPPVGSIGPNPPGTSHDGLFQIPHLLWENGQPTLDHRHTTGFLTFGPSDATPYYWLALTALIIVLVVDILIKSSRVGRAWEATREDEDAAEVMGVPTFRYKLLAFALGAAVGGLAGAIYAPRQTVVYPTSFMILLSELFVAAVIIGGAGNRWGALLGGFLVAYIPERVRELNEYNNLAFGVVLVALVIWRPQGLLPPRRTRRANQAKAELDELEEGVHV